MPAPKMQTRFADRFDIERLAGSGGMGEVFRAWDASTQSVVALKVVRADDGAFASESEGAESTVAERFLREAEVLAQLSHPAIVRHVGHGITEDRRLWLAMEWLDGEDLQKRLARKGLTVREALSLIERLADALGAVHARGVVHRDIKPSNVYLAAGADGEPDVARPKLLDFGIARLGHGARVVTQTGVVIGTPGYMSPEQARGERVIDARSDVFALGCVAFEALVGRPVFAGSHALAILAKIVLEEVPSVRSIRGDLPPAVDELIARMLEKDPAQRFRDGREVAEAIRSIGALSGSIPAPSRASAPGSSQAITDGEQRLVSVVAARTSELDTPALPLDATLPAVRPRIDVVALREAVKPFGARLEVLQDLTVVATLGSRAAATDQATSAARAAIALKIVLGPAARIAVATGRGVVGVDWAVGEVIDRVAQLLRASESPGIVLDEVTSGLLDPRFDLSPVSAEISELRGEARDVDATRPLLGKPTPCVGRERELATLEAAVTACIEDGMAHAVVVTAAAGVGKSRLRHELVRRVMGRGEQIEIWTARGDPLRAGSAFALLGGAVRAAAGILEGEPLEIRRDKLRARIERHLKSDVDRVVTFVGEAIGIPPLDAGDSLRAAKADAVLLGDQIRRAFEDWLDAESKAHPLLIVLEDLHHGDLPTVRVIDAALRNLADRPLLVLALGRPELDATFGDLFRDRPRTELRLGELPKRACERIVRHALGELEASVVERIVSESAGNALYLEELVRARAEGEEDLPATLLAMVQARLERLEPEARRVLRAASVFGHAFWRAGVRALLADETIDPWIDALIERESIVPRTAGRFAGEEEIAFRHAVVREAAYGMLTDEDRMLGHRLAAEWLARVGETDALVLAEHWERGGEPLRAIEQYRRAAEQALGGTDLAAAIARAERGIACGADGVLLGALRAIQAEAHKWRGEFREAETAGRDAMRALPPRTAPWYAALSEVVAAVDRQGKIEELLALAALLPREPLFDAEAHAIASVRVAVHLTGAGRYAEADALLQSFSRAVGLAERGDPLIAARVHQAHAMRARLEGKPDRARAHDEAAAAAFDAIGDARRATNHRLSASYGDLQLGDWARATEGLTRGLAAAERLGLVGLAASARHNLGLALARQRRFEEARSFEERAIAIFAAHADPRMEGASRMYLAEILGGEAETSAHRDALLDRAEKEASRAVSLLEIAPPLKAQALAVKARVLLARGKPALELARAAIEATDSVDDGDALVRLAFAEALEAAGELALARAAIEEARTRLLARAARLEDDATRAAFLRNIPEHARTLALWERWSHRAPQNRL